jgi:hypothetical protein
MGQDNLEVNGKGEYEIMMIHNGIWKAMEEPGIGMD